MNPEKLRRLTTTVAGNPMPALTRGRLDPFAFLLLQDGSIAKVPRLSLRLSPDGLISYHESTRSSPNNCGLLPVTIVPQMHCNAGCGYCINNEEVSEGGVAQRVPNVFMAPPTITAVVKFIEREVERKGHNGVDLMLFGGEPLINPSRCYEILDAIKPSAAHIITNGTLLTVDVAEELTIRRVKDVQITFDGNREDHDATRFLVADNGGTYEQIVANLRALDARPELLPDRRLRVNVSAKNLGGLHELIWDLASRLDPSIYQLYYAPVDDNGIGWEGALPPGEGQALLDELALLAAELGFRPSTNAVFIDSCGYCSGEFGDGGMVIGADGKLYSCWDSVGHPGKEVGNVWSGYKREGHEDRWTHCGDVSLNRHETLSVLSAISEATWAYLKAQVQGLLGVPPVKTVRTLP
jgi:uncharacterized protein